MLELRDIHTYYGDSHILQGVSLEVKTGSLVALVGRNGVGKTTLVHSIMGFHPAPPGTDFVQRAGHHPRTGGTDSPGRGWDRAPGAAHFPLPVGP